MRIAPVTAPLTVPPPARRPAPRTASGPPPARAWAARLASLLVVASWLAAASAQTVSFGAGVADGSLAARVAVEDVPQGRGTVGLAAVLSPAPGLDLQVRGAQAFGPLGTLTLEGAASARALPELRARAMVGARGAFGPVAGRLEARAWGAPPERFDPLRDPGATRAASGASLLVAVEGRLDGTWLLGGTVRGERGSGAGDAAGWLVDGAIEARARRLLGPSLDLELRAGGRVAGAGDGRLHLAAGVTHAARRAPEIVALAFVDVAPDEGGVRLAPGLESHGALPALGGRVDWRLRWRPLAATRAPWWHELAWSRALEVGTLRVEGSLGHGGAAGTAAAVAVRYERPLELP